MNMFTESRTDRHLYEQVDSSLPPNGILSLLWFTDRRANGQIGGQVDSSVHPNGIFSLDMGCVTFLLSCNNIYCFYLKLDHFRPSGWTECRSSVTIHLSLKYIYNWLIYNENQEKRINKRAKMAQYRSPEYNLWPLAH